jgi:hypothetical protein
VTGLAGSRQNLEISDRPIAQRFGRIAVRSVNAFGNMHRDHRPRMPDVALRRAG